MAIQIFCESPYKGETENAQYAGCIQIQSVNWGERQRGTFATNTGGGHGVVEMGDVRVTSVLGTHSSKILKACAAGDHVNNMKIYFCKAGGDQKTFCVVSLNDCMLSSYEVSGMEDSDHVVESWTINFNSIEMTYNQQKKDGSIGGAIKGGWKQSTAQAI
jgi:type VI secretion system secreted protein Hcp